MSYEKKEHGPGCGCGCANNKKEAKMHPSNCGCGNCKYKESKPNDYEEGKYPKK